jgi:tetratricopeptide (TPR) repeat protein
MIRCDQEAVNRWRRAVSMSVAAFAMVLLSQQSMAQFAGRLIDVIEADEQDDHVNIAVQFSCSVRYVAHNPASRADYVRIQLRLGGDCGDASSVRAPETPLVGGSSRAVTSARLDSGALGEVLLELRWQRELDFVLVPTSDGRGVRLRLLNVSGRIGRITVGNVDEAPEGYSVNLESSREPISDAAIQQAATRFKVPIYVSEIDLDGVRWYRLRAGPFSSRRDAEQVLLAARTIYGRAWLGVNDETAVVEPVDSVASVAVNRPVDPALPQAERDALQREARAAFNKRDYPRAIELLTKLLRQPEFPQRAAAQEMIGLARERSSQLAQAKGEYEEYLRRYPAGPAATRIRGRLRILAAASRSPRGGLGLASDGKPLGWSHTGSASQLYQGGREHIDVSGEATDRTSVNVSLTDVDWMARRHGERFDFMSRVSGGYTKDLLTNGRGGQGRVASFYADLADRQLGISGRIGRQSHTGDGILGIFDGVFASWQKSARLTFNAAIGFPADTTRDGFSSERQFVALSARFGPLRGAWDVGAFVVNQQLAGRTDRQAIGLETRYFVPGRTAVLLVDYDVNYAALNSAILMGNWQLPARWILSFDVSHRRTPILMTRNALIGQPVRDFDTLETLFTADEIVQLALDRTPVSDSVALSLSHPIGAKWQFMMDAFALRIGESPASGGVLANPDSGWDRSLQLQFSGASWWNASDLHFLSTRYQQSRDARSYMLSWSARFPLVGAWRIGPLVRAERRERFTDQSTQTLYTPELRLDFARGASIFDLNLGAELSTRELPADDESIRRLYLLAAYRYRF